MNMKKYMKRGLALAAAGVLTLGLFSGCSSSKSSSGSSGSGVSGTVATDGSTSMETVIGALKEAFQEDYSDIKVTYNPTGSGTGITAVSEGTCDIGLSSRYLKDEEKEEGLEETVIALDGIAVIVNTSNPVTDLTLEQIAAIYTGEITNWSELGGDDAEIVLIGREASSGTPWDQREERVPLVHMNGQEVYKFAVSNMPKRIMEVLEKAQVAPDDVKWVIPHQANKRIIDATARRVKGIPPERFCCNIHKYGNTSSATIPIVLDEWNRAGLFQRGDLLVLTAAGAGLSSAACLIRW